MEYGRHNGLDQRYAGKYDGIYGFRNQQRMFFYENHCGVGVYSVNVDKRTYVDMPRTNRFADGSIGRQLHLE